MRRLLIDGDIPVHRFAHVNQHALAWDADTWSYFGDLGHAKLQLDAWIDDLMRTLVADEYMIFLSDTEANWRHDIMPTYKGHRASWHTGRRPAAAELPLVGPARPLLHKPLREWLLAERDAVVEPSLEADDQLGIYATASSPRGDALMVTVDKDLRTVPGWHWNPDRADEGLVHVDEDQARRYHLYQTLVGDTSDGYKGCPGIGPVKAKAILNADDSWDAVVSAYEKAKLTEEDALLQARVARVLHSDDYDFNTREIRLWQPQ